MQIFILAAVLLTLNYSPVFSTPERPIGINLYNSGPFDSQILFVDIMKQSHEWMVQDTQEAGWDLGLDFAKTSDGYPTQVPFLIEGVPHQVHTLMLFAEPLGYPTGDFTFSFSGTGRVRLSHDAGNLVFTRADVEHTVTIAQATLEGINLTILESSAADPVHNIQLFLPGFSKEDSHFHPTTTGYLARFDMLRFMKSFHTEDSPIQHWADRTTRGYYTQHNISSGGMAFEYAIELVNALDKDIWVTVPYRASDDYITQLARLLRDSLETERKIYLEYANETWNTSYDVHDYSAAKGDSMGFATEGWENSAYWSVYRAVQMNEIFAGEFGGSDRFIKMISGFFAYDRDTRAMMNAMVDPRVNPDNLEFDALAIGAYFCGELPDRLYDAGLVADMTVDQFMDSMQVCVTNDLNNYAQNHKAIADSMNLTLISYEAGEGLTSFAYPDDVPLNTLMLAAQRHPRMQNVYSTMIESWYGMGGDMLTIFALMGNYNQYQTYGRIFESVMQDPATSFKWQALQEGVFNQNSAVDKKARPGEFLFPLVTRRQVSVSPDKLKIEFAEPVGGRLVLYSVKGEALGQVNLKDPVKQVHMPLEDILPAGVYLLGGMLNNKRAFIPLRI